LYCPGGSKKWKKEARTILTYEVTQMLVVCAICSHNK
jgi:hypothetical protein